MQRIQLPVKMLPLSSTEPSLGKNIFSKQNEGKVMTFIIVNNYHAIHRIRDSIPRNEFLAVFASHPVQQRSHHTNPCLFCVFVPLSPSSFRGAKQNSSTKSRGAHDICFGRLPMFILIVKHDTLRTLCSMHSM